MLANKSLSCVQKVGQHFLLANNVWCLRTCSFFVGQQAANGALWLVGYSKHHDAEWTDASYVDYTNYTSPFYLYIIHDCTQTDFGRLRFHLRAIKQITAAATSSSSAESAISAILLDNIILLANICLSCDTNVCQQMLANKCLTTFVGQHCLSCVRGFRSRPPYCGYRVCGSALAPPAGPGGDRPPNGIWWISG